jgi:hypothetical protein
MWAETGFFMCSEVSLSRDRKHTEICRHKQCFVYCWKSLLPWKQLWYLGSTTGRLCAVYQFTGGWDSTVGTATGYGLEGPGFELRWG